MAIGGALWSLVSEHVGLGALGLQECARHVGRVGPAGVAIATQTCAPPVTRIACVPTMPDGDLGGTVGERRATGCVRPSHVLGKMCG